jgi:hypothetical protein
MQTTSATPPLLAPPPPTITAPELIDPARLAAARALVAVLLSAEQREEMMASAVNNLASVKIGVDKLDLSPAKRAAYQGVRARIHALLLDDVRTAMPQLTEAYVRAYARIFTVDEMASIKVFAQTPAGVKFVHDGPALVKDPDIAAWYRALAIKTDSQLQAEFAKLHTNPAVGKGHTS